MTARHRGTRDSTTPVSVVRGVEYALPPAADSGGVMVTGVMASAA